MEFAELKAEERKSAGKESSKKLRRRGKIPATIYSNGKARSIAINARDFTGLTHSGAGSHVIVKLSIEGTNERPNAIIKEIQKNAVKAQVVHVDFQEVALDQKISAAVPIEITGESPGIAAGGVLEHHLREVELEGLPKDMPDHVKVDISGLELGGSLHAGSVLLPPGIEMLTSTDTTVLAITSPAGARVATEAVEGIAPESVSGGAESAVSEVEE